jgi:hypothetical protein
VLRAGALDKHGAARAAHGKRVVGRAAVELDGRRAVADARRELFLFLFLLFGFGAFVWMIGRHRRPSSPPNSHPLPSLTPSSSSHARTSGLPRTKSSAASAGDCTPKSSPPSLSACADSIRSTAACWPLHEPLERWTTAHIEGGREAEGASLEAHCAVAIIVSYRSDASIYGFQWCLEN